MLRTRRTGFILILAIVSGIQAETLTLEPARDNTLYEDAEGGRSNGAGNHLFVGRTGKGVNRRALLAFNLSDIPPNATVTQVSLTLNMSRTISGAQTVELRRVLANWGEGSSDARAQEGDGIAAAQGDVTWLHRFFNTSLWRMPGGDFADGVSAQLTVDSLGVYTVSSTPELVADAQGWVKNPEMNFGWILLGNETVNITAKRFDSRENADATLRPKLTVAFEAAPVLPGDFNGDTTVGFSDFLLFVLVFNTAEGDENFNPVFDLDNTKRVDFGDFLIFAANFGRAGDS